MFTGIIEEIGNVLTVTDNKITVGAKKILQGTKIGDSIAVNGVCLTVTSIGSENFTADISPETKNVTKLDSLTLGSYVNLERALPADGRFGGHIVSGHIDGTGRIKSITKQKEFYTLIIELSEMDSKYVIKKGSVTINGISLTVAEVVGNSIRIAVIPHTYENTNLNSLNVGDYVNVETDILAKYIEKFLSTSDNRTGISMDFLRENGF